MNYQSVEDIFEQFDQLKVLIIGDVMVDAYIWGKVDRISPEAPVPVVQVGKRDDRLGGAANVALNIQALGASPILCAVIGDDEGGTRFKKRLTERGIAFDGIVTSTERPTTVKTRVISDYHHIVRVDEEVTNLLSSSEESDLWERIQQLLPNTDVVIFEDYDKGVLSEGIIKKCVDLANEHNIPTVVDPKKRNFLSYKNTTLFKPNLKELREGLKLDFANDAQKDIEKAVALLLKELNSQSALITLSERGVFIDAKDQKHLIPAHIREISDVSGAGDTVISIAALATALDLPPFLVAALSNLGGGLVCEYIGVVPIDKESLMQEAIKHDWL